MFPFILRSNLTKTLNFSFFYHSYSSLRQKRKWPNSFISRSKNSTILSTKNNNKIKRSFQFILLGMKCFNLAFNTIFKIPNCTRYAKAISNTDMSEHTPTENINCHPFLSWMPITMPNSKRSIYSLRGYY